MRYIKTILWTLVFAGCIQAQAITNEELLQSMAGKYTLIPNSVKVLGYSSQDHSPQTQCRPQLTIVVKTLNNNERGLRIYSQGDGETGSFIEYTMWDLKAITPLSFEDRSGGVLYHWNTMKTDLGIQFTVKVMPEEGSVPDAQAICQYKLN